MQRTRPSPVGTTIVGGCDIERLRGDVRMSSTHSTTMSFRLTSDHMAGDQNLDDLEDDDNLVTHFKPQSDVII